MVKVNIEVVGGVITPAKIVQCLKFKPPDLTQTMNPVPCDSVLTFKYAEDVDVEQYLLVNRWTKQTDWEKNDYGWYCPKEHRVSTRTIWPPQV